MTCRRTVAIISPVPFPLFFHPIRAAEKVDCSANGQDNITLCKWLLGHLTPNRYSDSEQTSRRNNVVEEHLRQQAPKLATPAHVISKAPVGGLAKLAWADELTMRITMYQCACGLSDVVEATLMKAPKHWFHRPPTGACRRGRQRRPTSGLISGGPAFSVPPHLGVCLSLSVCRPCAIEKLHLPRKDRRTDATMYLAYLLRTV